MSTILVPPIVNDQGNINVHVDEGAVIPIGLQNEDSTEVDASDIALFFISGAFRKALDQDPNDAEGRVLNLTPGNLVTIVHGAPFRVVDETNPTQPVIRWEGKIYKRG